jgi:5-methylcytosine-specific restriction enzyme A
MKTFEFLKKTNGFVSITFEGYYNADIDLLEKCYNEFLRTGINYYDFIHELISINFYSDNTIIEEEKATELLNAIKLDFITKNVSQGILLNAKYFLLRNQQTIDSFRSYEARRSEANKVLANEKIRRTIMQKYNYKCNICKSEYDLTIDHIISVANGGSNELSNLQVLCRKCNSKKGVK